MSNELRDQILRNFDMGSYRAHYERELGEIGKMNTSGWVDMRCPFPGHPDKKPSFGVNLFHGGYRCQGCGVHGDAFDFYKEMHDTDFKGAIEYFADFLGIDATKTYKKAKNKPRGKLNDIYQYIINGKVRHETLRFSNPKSFSQRRPHPTKKGEYINNLNNIEVIPYHADDLPEATSILCPEGEKDANALKKLGFVATCNPMGAGKWPDSLTPYFNGKDIIILPDNDEAGKNHAKLVSSKLYDVAKSIKIINLPGLKEGGDVSDWLAAGNTKETLLELVLNTKPYQDHIDFLNEKHAVIMIGGKCVVLNEGVDPISGHPMITFSSMHDFEIRYANRKIPNPKAGQKGQRKNIPITSDWKGSSRRRQFNGIVFAPEREVPGFYNAWKGFRVEPKSGDIKPYLDHVRIIICNGDEKLFTWVVDCLADIFKNPGGKLHGSSLTTRGKKGVGKGLLVYPLELILGSHFVPVTGENEFLGPFNSHIAHAIIIYANEAFWAGRKTAEGQLKARITERTLLMNEKFLPAIKITNHARIIMASNESWVVPASMGERRFCVLDVSDERKGDTEYFNRMFKWCENRDNLAALLHFFQNRAITSNLRQPPVTDGLAEQIELSMGSIDRFWVDCLDDGRIDGGEYENPDGFKGWIKSGGVNEGYIQFCNDLREQYPKSKKALTMRLKELCEGIIIGRHTFSSGQERGLKIPSLDACRAEYNRKVGIERFKIE